MIRYAGFPIRLLLAISFFPLYMAVMMLLGIGFLILSPDGAKGWWKDALLVPGEWWAWVKA